MCVFPKRSCTTLRGSSTPPPPRKNEATKKKYDCIEDLDQMLIYFCVF